MFGETTLWEPPKIRDPCSVQFLCPCSGFSVQGAGVF